METKSFHRYRLVHMTVANICWAASLKGNRVVSRIFQLPCEVCLTSTKKEAFRNSSLLFSPSAFSVPMKQKTKDRALLWPHLSIIFPVTGCFHPHHNPVPVLSITQLQEYRNHTASIHSVTAVIYWENTIVQPSLHALRKHNFSSRPDEKLCEWSKLPERSHMHSLWHLMRIQSIKIYLY